MKGQGKNGIATISTTLATTINKYWHLTMLGVVMGMYYMYEVDDQAHTRGGGAFKLMHIIHHFRLFQWNYSILSQRSTQFLR